MSSENSKSWWRLRMRWRMGRKVWNVSSSWVMKSLSGWTILQSMGSHLIFLEKASDMIRYMLYQIDRCRVSKDGEAWHADRRLFQESGNVVKVWTTTVTIGKERTGEMCETYQERNDKICKRLNAVEGVQMCLRFSGKRLGQIITDKRTWGGSRDNKTIKFLMLFNYLEWFSLSYVLFDIWSRPSVKYINIYLYNLYIFTKCVYVCLCVQREGETFTYEFSNPRK